MTAMELRSRLERFAEVSLNMWESPTEQADSIHHLHSISDGSATRSVIKNAPCLRAARQSEQTSSPALDLVGCIDRPILTRSTMQAVVHRRFDLGIRIAPRMDGCALSSAGAVVPQPRPDWLGLQQRVRCAAR
jgi:hypothetical protein